MNGRVAAPILLSLLFVVVALNVRVLAQAEGSYAGEGSVSGMQMDVQSADADGNHDFTVFDGDESGKGTLNADGSITANGQGPAILPPGTIRTEWKLFEPSEGYPYGRLVLTAYDAEDKVISSSTWAKTNPQSP